MSTLDARSAEAPATGTGAEPPAPDDTSLDDTAVVDHRSGDGRRTVHRRRSERGASLVEYALLVALIAVVMIGSVQLLGETAGDSLENSSSSVADAASS